MCAPVGAPSVRWRTRCASACDLSNHVLAMISIEVLIYFIHHVFGSVQAKFSSSHQRVEWLVWVSRRGMAYQIPCIKSAGRPVMHKFLIYKLDAFLVVRKQLRPQRGYSGRLSQAKSSRGIWLDRRRVQHQDRATATHSSSARETGIDACLQCGHHFLLKPSVLLEPGLVARRWVR